MFASYFVRLRQSVESGDRAAGWISVVRWAKTGKIPIKAGLTAPLPDPRKNFSSLARTLSQLDA
jgi:hypothetical protein